MDRSKRGALITLLMVLVTMSAAAVMAVMSDDSDGEPTWEEYIAGADLPPPAGGLYIVDDMYWLLPDAGEAARRSDLIARAEVTRRLDSFWSTHDGKRPRNLTEEQVLLNPNLNIFTPYELQIKSVLKGEGRSSEMITLNRVGGRVGEDIVAVEFDAFSFTPGTEVVLFLRDCGQERVNRFNDPAERFRIIDRYQLDKGGEPLDPSVTYGDLVKTVESEGALEAKGGGFHADDRITPAT